MANQNVNVSIAGQSYNVAVSIGGGVPNPTGWYSVKAYGAVGDGVTNDATAIQSAIDACEAAGGGTVFLPFATYIIASTITIDGDNVEMVGPAVIKRASGFTTASSMLNITGAANIKIDGISLDGADTSTDYVPSSVRVGVRIAVGCENVMLNGLHIYDVYGDSIYIGTTGTTPDKVKVRDCTIERSHRNGISVTNGDNVSITGCVVKDCYQTAIDCEPNDVSNSVKNLVIEGNQLSVSLTHAMDSGLTYYARLIDVTSVYDNIDNVVVAGNALVKRADSGDLDDTSALHDVAVFIAKAASVIFSNNDVYTNYVSSSTTYGVITIRDYGTLNGFGNVLRCAAIDSDGEAWGTYKAMFLGFTTDPLAHEKTNFGCTVSGNAYAGLSGVRLLGGRVDLVCGDDLVYPYALQLCTAVTINVDGVPVSGKLVTMTADDATPSVAAATHLITVANTGATAITQLDGSVAGQTVTIVCNNATNAPTITDGGNFALSANWTPDINDVLTVMTINGGTSATWREISRSAN